MRIAAAILAFWALLLVSLCMAEPGHPDALICCPQSPIDLADGIRPCCPQAPTSPSSAIEATAAGKAIPTRRLFKAISRRDETGVAVGTATQGADRLTIYSTTTIYLPTTGTYLKSSGSALPSSIAPVPKISSGLIPSQSSSRVIATGSSSSAIASSSPSASPTTIPVDNAAALKGAAGIRYVATAITIAILAAQIYLAL